MASGIYGLRLLAEPRVRTKALAVLVGVVLVGRLAQLLGYATGPFWGYDFSAYWQAALNLIHGASPYSQAQLDGPYVAQQQYLYLYPPALAAVVTPLAAAFSDYRLAACLWAAGAGVLLVASVHAVASCERLGDRFSLLRGRGVWWLVAASFAFPSVIAELAFGNVHLVLLALLAAGWLGIRQTTLRGDAIAGIAIGAAAMVKVFPGLLILWLLATRRFRAAGAALASIALIVLLTLPLTGVQPWLDYPRVLENLGPPAFTTDAMAPIAWLTPLLGFQLAQVTVTVLGIALVGLIAIGGRRPKAEARSGAAAYGAVVALSVLVAPAAYQNYLALLVLPLLLGLSAGVRLRWLALAYLLMWGGTQPALGELAWVLSRGFPTLGALLLLGVLIDAVLTSSDRRGMTPRSIPAAEPAP